MNNTLNHWAQPFLNAAITTVKTLSGGCQHQTDYVLLADKSHWICKKMRRESWLGLITYSKLTFMKNLDIYLSEQNFQTLQCDQVVRLSDQSYGVILAYQEGRFLTALTKEKSGFLGRKLAELHHLNVDMEGATPFPKIELSSVLSIPEWVQSWALASNHHIYSNQEDWVLGHRDLNLTNIIWSAKEMPVFIDWESAGWIQANVDLVGLAINCALTKKGYFNKENFQSVLIGYKSLQGQLPSEDQALWILLGHSWLLWYQYTLMQGWQDQASCCLKMLGRLSLMRNLLRQLYLKIM